MVSTVLSRASTNASINSKYEYREAERESVTITVQKYTKETITPSDFF